MKLLRQKTLLIFDFDGTLVDSSMLHDKAFQEVLKPWQIIFDYEDIKGLKTKDAIIQLLDAEDVQLSNLEIDHLVQQKQALTRASMHQDLKLMPHVFDFLQKACMGYDMVIVSASSRISIDAALKKFNLQSFFKCVIASEDVKLTKPHPEGFLLALDKMQAFTQQALIFEDSEPGFLAAKAAGIEYINVNDFDWKYD